MCFELNFYSFLNLELKFWLKSKKMSSSNHFDLIYGELFGSSNKINDTTKPNSSIGENKVKKGPEGRDSNKKIYEKMLKKRK